MSEKIKVITFNLRVAVKVDGVNYFDNRLPRIIEFLKAEQPDVVGFQEVNAHMKELLNQNIEDYVLVGCGREKDYNGESALIGYRKDKFELIKFENFWLSATPDVPGSRYGFDQSVCPRITSAALLKARSGGSPFWVELPDGRIVVAFQTDEDVEGTMFDTGDDSCKVTKIVVSKDGVNVTKAHSWDWNESYDPFNTTPGKFANWPGMFIHNDYLYLYTSTNDPVGGCIQLVRAYVGDMK
jgi:hypothetical protein